MLLSRLLFVKELLFRLFVKELLSEGKDLPVPHHHHYRHSEESSSLLFLTRVLQSHCPVSCSQHDLESAINNTVVRYASVGAR